ncbi:sulfurtransferase TusA family protein [Desulfocucumis palustris]|nr:sulfurtransferase TusA family protein [Desulfocucumis palustris]
MVDARGLLCPEPVLLTKKVIDNLGGGVVRVMVDNNAAKENVTRLAENKGWGVEAALEGGEYILTLKK